MKDDKKDKHAKAGLFASTYNYLSNMFASQPEPEPKHKPEIELEHEDQKSAFYRNVETPTQFIGGEKKLVPGSKEKFTMDLPDKVNNNPYAVEAKEEEERVALIKNVNEKAEAEYVHVEFRVEQSDIKDEQDYVMVTPGKDVDEYGIYAKTKEETELEAFDEGGFDFDEDEAKAEAGEIDLEINLEDEAKAEAGEIDLKINLDEPQENSSVDDDSSTPTTPRKR